MGIWTMLLTGIGLSMDAFAVSVCKGLGMRKMQYVQALVIGLFFGGFQALMPMLGYFLGTQFADYIREFDHCRNRFGCRSCFCWQLPLPLMP